MQIGTNGFDLWVFHKQHPEPAYLLLHTSQEKADKWFNGGRFWQILGGPVRENEDLEDALVRPLSERGLTPTGIWAVEHTYTFYNLRRRQIEILPVFAAQVPGPKAIPLSWEHSEFGWYSAAECMERLRFRGLKDGLRWAREYVTEVASPLPELRVL